MFKDEIGPIEEAKQSKELSPYEPVVIKAQGITSGHFDLSTQENLLESRSFDHRRDLASNFKHSASDLSGGFNVVQIYDLWKKNPMTSFHMDQNDQKFSLSKASFNINLKESAEKVNEHSFSMQAQMPKCYNKSLQEHFRKQKDDDAMVSPRSPFCKTSEATLRENKMTRGKFERFKTKRYRDIDDPNMLHQSSVLSM